MDVVQHSPVERLPARKLRVVRVYWHLEVGGIESRLVDLLPRLDRRIFDVQLVCIKRPGQLAPLMRQRGVAVHVARYHRRLPRFFATRSLTLLFSRLAPDIVHAHSGGPAHVATLAARKAGVPIVIANFHSDRLFRTPSALRKEREVESFRDVTVHVSERAHRAYLERVRPAIDSGVVLYNGVDIDRFAAPLDIARRRSLERELRIDGHGPVLLMVARLHDEKGHDCLLRAFVDVRKVHPEAVLLLVGGGRRHSTVEANVRELGLAEAVRLTGVRADVHDLFQLATVHALPSTREGFSNVVLEALAAGVPQVLTDAGGNCEAIGESGAALFVEPDDSSALAEALLRILGDPQLRTAMSRAARERVRRFSIDEQVRRTEELYLGLASQKMLP